MTVYFTSDTHLFHRNILSFESRPFESVGEMNDGLIKAWNSVVEPEDIVYHLGDFMFGSITKWKETLPKFNGKIRLCRGNHDDSKTVRRLAKEGYFDEYHEIGTYIKISGYQLWLTHYPMEIGMRPMKYSLSGHIHSTPSRMPNQINVGVDSPLNFNRPFGQPISQEELIAHLDYINPIVEEQFQKERGFTV